MFHIAVILALLLFVRWTAATAPAAVEHVVVLDFTYRTELNQPTVKA